MFRNLRATMAAAWASGPDAGMSAGRIRFYKLRAYVPAMTKRNWRRTSFKGPDGTTNVAPDDWTLCDDVGRPLARIYHHLFGPNVGRWFWTVLVAPDGTPFNAGMGDAATEAEAREICEAMVTSRERRPCCDDLDAD
jgi:hypothetical protein